MLYIVTRLLQAFVVMIGVALVGFLTFQYVGDPVLAMVGQETSIEDRELLRERLGLNDPVIVQFGRFVGRAAVGDFGLSYSNHRPVMELIAERAPATLELVIASGILALALAIPLGVYTGIRRFGVTSQVILALSVIGVSIPSFLLGVLLILVFSVWFTVLPSFGRGETLSLLGVDWSLFTPQGLTYVIMPAFVLCLFQMGVILRLIRAEMLEVLNTDYIRFAWARGLKPSSIYFKHALRNTLVPVITAVGLQLSSLFAFSIITERVFQWPGMGQLLLQAIENTDVPMLAAYLVIVGLFFVLTNLVIDLIYFAVDPRIRSAGR